MNIPRRMVSWALQPAAERAIRDLQRKLADKTEENRQLDRKLGAATERANGWYREFRKAGQLAELCANDLVRAVRRKVCVEEGHRACEVTGLGDTQRKLRCGRCGFSWAEPYEAKVRPAPHD